MSRYEQAVDAAIVAAFFRPQRDPQVLVWSEVQYGEVAEGVLSPWFPPEIKPVHSGFYRGCEGDPADPDADYCLLHWNGARWAFAGGLRTTLKFTEQEFRPLRRYSKQQCFHWRGVAREGMRWDVKLGEWDMVVPV